MKTQILNFTTTESGTSLFEFIKNELEYLFHRSSTFRRDIKNLRAIEIHDNKIMNGEVFAYVAGEYNDNGVVKVYHNNLKQEKIGVVTALHEIGHHVRVSNGIGRYTHKDFVERTATYYKEELEANRYAFSLIEEHLIPKENETKMSFLKRLFADRYSRHLMFLHEENYSYITEINSKMAYANLSTQPSILVENI